MYDYSFSKVCNPTKLLKELQATGRFTSVDSLSTSGETVIVSFKDELTHNEYVTVQQVISSHSAASMEAVIMDKLRKSLEFGQRLMIEYGTSNMMAGRTTAEIVQISDKLARVQQMILSGSLRAAISEIDKITPDSLVSQETIDKFKQDIQNFLATL